MPKPQLWLVPWEPLQGELPLGELADPERRWAAALPPDRRRQYGVSRLAMRRLLSGVLAMPVQQVPLHSPPGEPPQLPPAQGSISLSHARGALLIAWSPAAIGVDLEAAERRFDARALMQRFFPLQEQNQLRALPPEPLRQAVLRSWLAKEAAIKWRQRSLASELTAWMFDHNTGLLCHRAEGLALKPKEGALEGWRWAAAGAALGDAALVPLIWRFAC